MVNYFARKIFLWYRLSGLLFVEFNFSTIVIAHGGTFSGRSRYQITIRKWRTADAQELLGGGQTTNGRQGVFPWLQIRILHLSKRLPGQYQGEGEFERSQCFVIEPRNPKWTKVNSLSMHGIPIINLDIVWVKYWGPTPRSTSLATPTGEGMMCKIDDHGLSFCNLQCRERGLMPVVVTGASSSLRLIQSQ